MNKMLKVIQVKKRPSPKYSQVFLNISPTIPPPPKKKLSVQLLTKGIGDLKKKKKHTPILLKGMRFPHLMVSEPCQEWWGVGDYFQ